MKRALLILAMFTAAGCVDSQAVFVEHLAIININPSHGAVSIGYATDATITFSELLTAESVSNNTVCLSDDANPPTDGAAPCASNTIPAQVTYDVNTLSVRIEPNDALLPDASYTIHITTGVLGTNGSLPTNVAASFSTIPTL